MKFDEITDDWVINEIEKIKYTYNLNKVIRYNLQRQEVFETQSVAEHVYNMLILAHYFRDLEDPENILDFEKVTKMILMHDMGEIITGDVVMHYKKEVDRITESEAVKEVAKKTPEFISTNIEVLCNEYDNFLTLEAKYVKAIDKIEAQFWFSSVCDLKMVKNICTDMDIVNNENKRRKLYKNFGFKFIEKFGQVLHVQAEKSGLLDGKVMQDFTNNLS